MAQNKIVTDENLMESAKHGTDSYPFKCYFEKLSQFDFHCIDWHWHTEWEFVYVESGSMTVCVGESMFSLSEGNGIFINSKILHKFYSSDETVIPNFLCMPSFLASENSLIYQKYIQPIVSSSLSYLILNGENLWQGEALEIMKQIFSAQDREVDGELLTSVLMQKLWLIIYENIDKTCMEEQVDDSGSVQARLQLMMQFLHQNYAEDISLEEIACYANISKSTVLNLFNRFLHITPINYLIGYRLKKAALLIKNTEKKINTISYETGFHNVDYFCRAFKKSYNMTPTEYRKSKNSTDKVRTEEENDIMIIRKYTEKDISEMIHIWNEVVEDGEAFPQEEFLDDKTEAEFFASQTYCGVADNDGGIVGLYILHPNNIGRCGHLANASYAVDSTCRGKHIGEKLVSDCLVQAKLHDFKILQFNAVVENNVHARHLYERLGFVQIGTVPNGFRMKDGTYQNICLYYKEV